MSSLNPCPTSPWLDGSSTHRDPSRLEWPLTASGVHIKLSSLGDTGIIIVSKSVPSIAFVGPDRHIRTYRVKHRRHRPLLPRLLLHKGPGKLSPIWATYKATTFREAWIEIPCLSTGSTEHGRVKVRRKQDGRKNKYVFTMKIEGREEAFGWRRSRSEAIKDLGLSQNRYKLVRLTTGTYASHAGPRTSDRMQIVALAGRSHHVFPRCVALRYLTQFGDE